MSLLNGIQRYTHLAKFRKWRNCDGTNVSPLYKRAIKFFLGSSFSKILGLLLIPVVARLYTPSEFGVLAQLMAISLILIPLSNLRLPTILPTIADANEFRLVCSLSIASVICVALLTLLGAWVYYLFTANTIYFYLSVIVLAGGIYELLYMRMVKLGRFTLLSRVQIAQVCMDAFVKVLMAFSAFKVYGLVIAYTVFHITSSALLFCFYGRAAVKGLFNFDRQELLQTLKVHKQIPLYRMPSQLLMVLSMQLPVIVCSYVYDMAEVGYLSFALVIFAVPASLVTQSIGNIYFAEIAKLSERDPRGIYLITKDVVIKLLLILSLPISLLYFLGAPIFSMVFGNEWLQAGILAENLSIYLLFQLMCSPIICIYSVFSMHYMFFLVNLLRLLVVTLVLLIGIRMDWGIVELSYNYAVLLAAYYIALMIIIWVLLKRRMRLVR